MSFYEAEGVIESAKKSAAELIQEIANTGVGEIFRIAVEETAFGRPGSPQVPDDGRKARQNPETTYQTLLESPSPPGRFPT
jgi:hypothetical protein